MGRLRKIGLELLRAKGLEDQTRTNRLGLILGTGWSDPAVLSHEGFILEREITFSDVGVDAGAGAGHPNRFLLGTWHGRKVVISQGRNHLYQERPGEESLIRKWMSVFLALMGQGTRVIITSSVGGVAAAAKTDMVVQPIGIVSAHLPMPYLYGNDGEFVMSEHLLWIEHRSSGIHRPLVASVFDEAAKRAKLPRFINGKHLLIPGPGFGGATERRLWASWECDTVGMSLDPELRLIALENMDNAAAENGQSDIQVFASFIITDDHDLPCHAEITASAKARAPQLGKFLSHVVASDW
ncbi:MAG: hypothetical protein WC654_06065 [Patescibacteria group bacterium]